MAILGNGLDICYPSEHNKLMKCIEEKGLLISEYQPGIQPDKYRFPRRNRLIGSWSDKPRFRGLTLRSTHKKDKAELKEL